MYSPPPSKQRVADGSAGPLPPRFPSAHGAPYVRCRHCFVLLLLPAHSLPPGTLSSRTARVTLKCSICLNVSTFSTRHLYAAASLAATGTSSPISFLAKEATESLSMPCYGASHGGTQEALVTETRTSAIPEYRHGISEFSSQFNCAVAHKANGEHISPQMQNSDTLLHSNGVCKHGPTEASKPSTTNAINGDFLELKKQFQACSVLNGDCGHMSQDKDFETGDFPNGGCDDALENTIVEARDCSSAESGRPQDKDNGDCFNDICELTFEEHSNKARECFTVAFAISNELQKDSHLDMEQESTLMSSVQNWVDSLAPEVGYESDCSSHCSGKCVIGCEKHGPSPQRSPLHQHFGYKTPSELFERIVFSEDEETRVHTDTSSTATSSSSSPNNACQQTHVRAACMQAHAPLLQAPAGGAVRSGGNSPKGEARDAQGSLARLLKRGLKKGNLSPASLKGKVVVNAHVLSSAAIKHAEEQAGKLRPGSYWYDCKAGFWGVEGGPCLGIVLPLIEELSYPMAGNCSNGDTQVYINGRELHSQDLAVLSRRGLPEKAGRAYALGFDGVLVDETTGLEVKHLGKLAPTVEQKGKGFGMFAGAVVQAKTPVVQGKPNN